MIPSNEHSHSPNTRRIMALSLLKKLFAKKATTQVTSESRRLDKHSFIVAEPYSMGTQSINDGFFRALLPGLASSSISKKHKEAVAKVKRLLNDNSQTRVIPRLPAVIPRLMRSLRDPDSNAQSYVAIINKDPAMSAAVLKLANTVYFNPGHKRITAIDTAVVKLGIEGLRSVLSAAVMQPVIQKDSPYFHQFGEQLWQHSLQCAVACERIAEVKGGEPYNAYLLGLIHDIGIITAFSELCRELGDDKDSDTEAPGYDVFAPLLKEHAAQLSVRIAREWEFPEVLCEALQQQVKIAAGDKVNLYGHTLYQANLVCEVLTATEFHPPKAVDKLLRALDLPEDLHQQLKSLSVDL